ncbi:MAG: polysaccharide pyruvyl transferase family protein [Flavobacteriaceae bacterium]
MDSVKNISVLDTSIVTSNVGDEIIMDAVNKELSYIFSMGRFLKIPTHEKIYKASLSHIRNADFTILGGSNILSSKMNEYKQWNISIPKAFLIQRRVITMGVGWRNYQKKPNFYTKKLLKLLLHDNYIHSVRDSYTEAYLKEIGFKNVLNTACPTMWQLTPTHCLEIPNTKSDTVVFTLTDYDQDVNRDLTLIESLLKNYSNVFFWIQGKKDDAYLHSFPKDLIKRVKIIAPNLSAYDNFLNSNTCDYIGTRLHGGIRALQQKRRTIIIGIDNRALEKKKDFNIPVLERQNINDLERLLASNFKTEIKIPEQNIEIWKKQFAENENN